MLMRLDAENGQFLHGHGLAGEADDDVDGRFDLLHQRFTISA